MQGFALCTQQGCQQSESKLSKPLASAMQTVSVVLAGSTIVPRSPLPSSSPHHRGCALGGQIITVIQLPAYSSAFLFSPLPQSTFESVARFPLPPPTHFLTVAGANCLPAPKVEKDLLIDKPRAACQPQQMGILR